MYKLFEYKHSNNNKYNNLVRYWGYVDTGESRAEPVWCLIYALSIDQFNCYANSIL